MTEYEYLRKMFFRLREAEKFNAEAKLKDKKDQRNEAWVEAIACSIKDYLELRKGADMTIKENLLSLADAPKEKKP
jgi:hypothetical protein